MDLLAPVLAGLVGVLAGSFANRLIVREPGYVITDPKDLPEGADAALLDELEPVPTDLPAVPVLAVLRPSTWWRRWFPATELVMGSTPSVSTSPSCSIQLMMPFSSRARGSSFSSGSAMRASLATLRTVAASMAMTILL